MIPKEFINELELVVHALREHQHKFNAKNLESPLKAFSKALKKFQSTISSIVADEEQSADVSLFDEQLGSSAARVLQRKEGFGAFTKIVLGKKFPLKREEGLREAMDRFRAHLIKNHLIKKASKAFEALIRESNRPEINLDVEIELLREIRHMGSLDDDELELAFATRYNNEKLLKKMAEAAHIKITPKAKVSGIAKKLIPYARNSFANTTF